IKDIPAIKCSGHLNIPDGEVYSAPVRDFVNALCIVCSCFNDLAVLELKLYIFKCITVVRRWRVVRNCTVYRRRRTLRW
ncbi:hypothetical protein ACT453_01120, partial [Bacillus sp. D-CC]